MQLLVGVHFRYVSIFLLVINFEREDRAKESPCMAEFKVTGEGEGGG